MIEKPLKCPSCSQLIADDKKGNVTIRSSTQVDESAIVTILRQCNRCKTKFIMEYK